MSDAVIRVEGLGKQYRLGGQRTGYSTLRDRIGTWMSPRGMWQRKAPATPPSDFWALKDVSFEVRPGEVVGIIGRNGAGKSTLLKILSQITEPTEGWADIHGRVGSLLEVGTGFHPELTGRENIFLNGAILGMKRSEIIRKFDEIVSFAEIEKFIDTPVKHFSSGMYMRLAFAVAAHLEPEILIVDEVLAVGDAEFQKKCLGKMGEVAKGGRTVLFVSHNMTAIRQLCSRAIILSGGRVGANADVAEAVARYLSTSGKNVTEWQDNRQGATDPTGAVRLTCVCVSQPGGDVAQTFAASEAFTVTVEYLVLRQTVCQIAFRLNEADGSTFLTTGDGDRDNIVFRTRLPGYYRSSVQIPGHLVPPGRYHLLVAANVRALFRLSHTTRQVCCKAPACLTKIG